MIKRYSTGIVYLLVVFAAAATAYGQRDFDGYWRKFSSAVSRNDKKAVAALTRFPLKDESENDEGPNPGYSEAKLRRNFGFFFNRNIRDCFRRPEFYLNNNDPTEKVVICANAPGRPRSFMFKRYRSGWKWINFNRD